jgi:hypothetical protein
MSIPLSPLPQSHVVSELVLALVAARAGVRPYPAGSAVIVAPGIALTANHVLDGFWQYFDESEDLPAGFSVQALQYVPGRSEPVVWHVAAAGRADAIDIAALSLRPSENVPKDYNPLVPTLDVTHPHPGTRVQAFGFPMSQVEQEERGWVIRHLAAGAVGVVGEVFPVRRDAGMLRFPCYEMSLPIVAGMSGGPVFDETGHLRGIICSSIDPELVPSYASVLWPAMGLQEPSLTLPAPTLLDLARAGIVRAINIAHLVARPQE